VCYLGGIASLSLLGLLSLIGYAIATGGTVIQLITITLLATVPILTSLLTCSIGSLRVLCHPTLPRLNFPEEGVPPEHCTMVVIPALLSTDGDTPFLTHQLEGHFLSNEDPNIHFALLTDFADAPGKVMPDDNRRVDEAKAAIEQLNKKYSRTGRSHSIFSIVSARGIRTKNAGWAGSANAVNWRNSINCSEAATRRHTKIQMGDLSNLPNIRYVVTLDADTPIAARKCSSVNSHSGASIEPA